MLQQTPNKRFCNIYQNDWQYLPGFIIYPANIKKDGNKRNYLCTCFVHSLTNVVVAGIIGLYDQ